MIRRLAAGLTALTAILAVSLSWAPSAEAYDPNVKPQPWAYHKGLIPVEARNLRNGLEGHWVMWEGSGPPRDIAGRGANATFPGGANDPAWVNARFGASLDFRPDDANNVPNYVIIPDNDDLDITGPISISAWVLPDDLSGGFEVILAKGKTASGDGDADAGPYSLAMVNNRVEFSIVNPSHTREAASSNSLSAGEWFHVVGTWDGTTRAQNIKVYGNGVLTGTDSQTNISSLKVTNKDLEFGRDQDRPLDERMYWDGRIDNVRLYERELSAGEVRTLYQHPLIDVWPEYSQQPTDGAAEEVAAPQIIIISWGTGLTLLTLLAYIRRREDYERSGFRG